VIAELGGNASAAALRRIIASGGTLAGRGNERRRRSPATWLRSRYQLLPRDPEQRRAPCTVVCRLKQLDLTYVLQAAVQENLLRRDVSWVGIGVDRFEAEGPEPVIDDGCRGFPSISVAPIRLTQPIPERGLLAAVTGAAVEPHTADQAVGFLQRDSEAKRPSGRVVLLHASDPLAPVGFGVGMRNGPDPAGDFPIAGERHQVGKVVIAVGPDARRQEVSRLSAAVTPRIEAFRSMTADAFRTEIALMLERFVARINSRAQSAPRSDIYVRRTYSGRPSSRMRFSEAAAMATSVVCRPSVRERSASPITRL
jgi:hypothetical protein